MEQRITLSAQRLCLLAGPAAMPFFFVGWFAGMKWVPAPNPTMSAEQVSLMYQANRFGLSLGFTLCMSGAAMLVPWAVSMTIWTRKTDSRFPILTYAQLVSLAISLTVTVLTFVPWAVAAFRAGHTSPEVTQVMHDLGWFLFLFDVPPFWFWFAAIGVGILWTPREHQMLPRWAGYLALLEAWAITPAMAIAFFRDGPFAYGGILALWLPFGSFFLFLPVMTVLCWKAINRQAALDESNGIDVHRHQVDLEEDLSDSVAATAGPPNVGVAAGADNASRQPSTV